MLLTAPEANAIDLSNWKVVIGGSAFPRGLAKEAAERGINAFAAYGLSESCPFLTTADMSGIHEVSLEEESIARRCKTGQPTVMVDLRVVDADMNEVAHDGESSGEVVVRTPWVTQGYTDNVQGSEALWQGGYMHTGDVGHLDKDGSLQITDRIKDVIKSGGEWISSLELEDIVSRCDGVGEVAAFGIPDAQWGERPMLVIVRAAESKLSANQIQDAIREQVDSGRLSKWAIPERIEFVDNLPKTSVGKMDKKVMRVIYGNYP